MVTTSTPTFEKSSEPSTGLQEESFSDTWDALRAPGIAPRVATEHRADEAAISAFDAGFRLLRLDRVGRGAFGQQARVIDCLSANRRYAVVMLPRQSAKTTTIEAYLLGLCAVTPELQVAYTSGTTGKFARDHFLKRIVASLERVYPDAESRPFRIRKSAGQERIAFDNGAIFQVCATPEDFRGNTFDVVWVDEAGELEGERRTELLAAAQPTQDTRHGVVIPTPLMVLSGTAGQTRSGSVGNQGNTLWDFLELGRAGDPSVSILEYSAGIDLTVEDVETWEQAEAHVLASHPGVGNLTTLETIRGNFATMPRPRFLSEYLGIFGDANNATGLILPTKWQDAALTGDLPSIPDDAALAMGIGYHEAAASVCAAWRDPDGIAHVIVVHWNEGTRWLPDWAKRYAAKHPKQTFSYDAFRSAMRTEVAVIQRNTPRPRLLLAKTPDAADAAALFMRELNSGNLRHYGQAQMDAAAAIARRREIGRGFGFGLPDEGGDVSPLEAAALALRAYDAQPKKNRRGVRFVEG